MKKKGEGSPLLDGLNKEQIEAVTCTDGPVLVIAGAGTGKTTVIARRITYIIEQQLAKPHEILALTFTDKAANEMEERVDQLLPYGSFDTQISTFHSFGERLLRENALEIGLPTDFKVLTKPQQVLFFQQNLFRFDLRHYRPLSTPTKFIQALITLFSRCKDECVTPKEYKAFAESLARGITNYELGIRNIKGPRLRKDNPRPTSPLVKGEEFSVSSLLERGRIKEGDNSDIDAVEIEKQLELAKVYEQYENFKATSGVVDFGDLIVKSYELLQKQPQLLKQYQSRFRYILVDEFQDTNYAQNELVKLLAAQHKNICVVGDDDQSVYKFRGAAISNILQFKDEYPKAKQVVLTTNYRSTQPILDGAYRLIQNNNPDRLETKHNIIKKLESAKGTAGFGIQPLYLPTVTEEIDTAVGEIERLTANRIKSNEGSQAHISSKTRIKQKTQTLEPIAEDSRLQNAPNSASIRGNDKGGEPSFDAPLSYNDIAILVRANSQAEPIMQSLAQKGIPFKFTGTSGLYDRPEIRTLISFLTVITNFYDNLQLYNLCIAAFYDLPIDDLIKFMDFASRKSKPLYWAIEHSEELGRVIDIHDGSRQAIAVLQSDIFKYAELTKSQDVGHVLYQFLTDKGILTNLQKEETAEAVTQIANIAKFFDKIKEFSRLTHDPSVKAFVDYLQVIREAGDDPGTATIDADFDGVNVMTVHAAKGLEFKVVFIINAVADKFPSRDRSEPIPLPDALIKETLPEGDFHLQEERRLFYVAMTRASDLLYITWARDYGGKRLRKVSPFVVEALGQENLPETVLAPATSKKVEQLGLFWGNTPENGNGHALPSVKSGQLTFTIGDDRLLSLNQSQVDNYLTCPLKYKYASILRIPLSRHHLFVYGAAMHSAVQTFYEHKMQQKTVPLAELLEVFEHSWSDEGFLSEMHEKERFNQGKLTLEKFWQREKDNPKIPYAIEKPFRVNLTDTIRLVGRIDRMDTDGNSVHIIDFKTTENIDEEKAQKRAKDSKQLAIYSLIYYKIAGKLPSKVSLYFIEDGIMGSFAPTAKTIQQAEEYVRLAAQGIKAGNFEAKPDFMACTYCPYSPICPYTAVKV